MKKPPPLLAVLTALLLGVTPAACSTSSAASAPGQPEKLELRYQGSANSVTLPELAEDLGYLGPIKLDWVGNTISGPQDIQSAATGQTDFGGAFTGAVLKLVQAGAPIKAVVNYYGSDQQSFIGFYVRDGSPIRTARDLIGKKVGVNTAGANLEAALDTWLHQQGLSDAEIKQVQLVVIPPVNAEQALRNNQLDVVALQSVLQDRAVAAGGVRQLFSDVQAFGPYNGGPYVLRTDFIKKYPETAKLFVSGVARAIEWERTTPHDQVIARFAKIIKARGRNEDTSTLKYWKSVGITRGGLISDRDYTLWSPWLHQTGVLGDDAPDLGKIYTNAFNPYAPAGSK